MSTRYIADPNNCTVHLNGAEVFMTPGPFASLAKIKHCPCEDGKRRTVQITGQPDTMWSAPGCVSLRRRGKTVTVSGFVSFGSTASDWIQEALGGRLLAKESSPSGSTYDEDCPKFIATGKHEICPVATGKKIAASLGYDFGAFNLTSRILLLATFLEDRGYVIEADDIRNFIRPDKVVKVHSGTWRIGLNTATMCLNGPHAGELCFQHLWGSPRVYLPTLEACMKLAEEESKR